MMREDKIFLGMLVAGAMGYAAVKTVAAPVGRVIETVRRNFIGYSDTRGCPLSQEDERILLGANILAVDPKRMGSVGPDYFENNSQGFDRRVYISKKRLGPNVWSRGGTAHLW